MNVLVSDIHRQDIHHIGGARFILAWRTSISSSVSSHKLSSIFDRTARNRSPHSLFLPREVTTVLYLSAYKLHVAAEHQVPITANIKT